MIEITTIGRSRILLDGREVHVPRTKDRALLVFLCFNQPKSFRRTFLAELLWNGDGEKAKHSLSQALYGIRRRFPGLLFATNETVGVAREVFVRIDVQDNARLNNTAPAACRSLSEVGFLEDLIDIGAIDFDHWRDQQASRIGNLLEDINPTEHANDFDVAQTVAPNGDNRSQLAHDSAQLDDPKSSQRSFRVPLLGRNPHMADLKALFSKCSSQAQLVTVCGRPGFGKTRLSSEFLDQ